MPFSTARHSPLPISSWRPARCLGLAALLLAITTEGLQNAAADGETRTLSLYHTHTHEELTVTFKRNGRYDEQGLAQLNHFLRDWRNDQETKMDPRLFDIVWEVYQEVGGKQPIHIISAYRSPATNAMLRRRSRGVAKFSQHMLGKAMDFNIPGVPLENIRIAGLRLQRGGVGFYPTSGSPFVHLDVGSVRHWPRMTHDQLVKIFPDGRTVHIPSDGRPLPGYALALADIERRDAKPSQVSLAAAREAGVPVAANGEGTGRRSLLARLFGFGEEDDEQSAAGERTTSVARVNDKAADAKAKPVKTASAVPMPRARPGAREALVAAKTGGAPNAAATPAQIVEARGLWRAADLLAAATAPVKTSAPRQRFALRAESQGTVVKDATTVVGKSTASARTAATDLAPDRSDVTASLPWPGAKSGDAPVGETVMAYADPSIAERAASPGPTASVPPKRGAEAKREAAPARADRPAAGAPRLIDNPWLRGLIAAPSVQSSMGVTVMGAPNYQTIAALMHKPRATVANGFARGETAPFGLITETFRGEAISFVPVVTFGTMTAQLY